MTLYAVVGFDHEPHAMSLRDSVRPEHRAYYLNSCLNIRMAGAFYRDENQCGTLVIVEASSEEVVRKWLDSEPFCQAGVYRDLEIREWRPALNVLEQHHW